jgi:hypothetical protein
MRLTLRTLLAYMDDILDPVDQQNLGKKIETSDFATDLIHRSRDVVRRLRLSAPEIESSTISQTKAESTSQGSGQPQHPPHGKASSVDPNTVAEYLDNTLTPSDVAEYERICLESDIHLAEVASCHHILTMVLGEPAEVGEEVRRQLYRLLPKQSGGDRLRIEPTHGSSRPEEGDTAPQPESLLANGPTAATSVFQTNGKHSVPDYLRKAAQVQRRNKLMLATATIAFMVIIGYFGWNAFTQPGVPKDVANIDPDSYDQIDIPPFDPSTTETSSATTEGSDSLDSTAAASGSSPVGASADKLPVDPLPAASTALPAADERTAIPEKLADEEAPLQEKAVLEVPTGTSNAMPREANPFDTSVHEGTNTDQSVDEPSRSAERPDETSAPIGSVANELVLDPADSESPTPTTDLDHQESGDQPLPEGPMEAQIYPDSGGPSDPIVGSQTGGSTSSTVPGGLPLDQPLNSNESADSDLANSIAIPPIHSSTPDLTDEGTAEETTTEPADNLVDEGPVRVGNYLGSHDILLYRDDAQSEWVRIAPRSDIFEGHQLLSMPTYTASVMLGGINASLSGGTQIAISRIPFPQEGVAPAQDHQPDLYLEIVFGRILMGAGLDGSDLVLKIDDNIRRLQLTKSANLALEVERTFEPGSDIEQTPAPIVARFFLTHGSLIWSQDGMEQTIESPAVWAIGDLTQEAPQVIDQLPDWIDGAQLTTSERLAQTALLDALAPGEPIAIRLQELTDPNNRGRKREVRTLAARCGMYMGEFEPLVKALNDPIQRPAWDTHIDTLRQAMALSPDVAKRAREAFVAFRGEEATNDLMRMVQGYSPEAIGTTPEEVAQGPIRQLIRFLDSSDLDFRVLAYYNLREITGKSYGGYQPGHNANQRKRAIRIWLDRLESGEILPNSTP